MAVKSTLTKRFLAYKKEPKVLEVYGPPSKTLAPTDGYLNNQEHRGDRTARIYTYLEKDYRLGPLDSAFFHKHVWYLNRAKDRWKKSNTRDEKQISAIRANSFSVLGGFK